MPRNRDGDLCRILISAGKFTCVEDAFLLESDSGWTNKGTATGGEFRVLNMGRRYRESDVGPALERESKRLNKPVHSATATDLLAFATLGIKNGKTSRDKSDQDGWNGTDWLMGFGSSFTWRNGHRDVPDLWGNGAERELRLLPADYQWYEHNLVLCVCD